MTSGERMVWAVAYEQAWRNRTGEGVQHVLKAVASAGVAVRSLRLASGIMAGMIDDDRAKLDDMLGTGADR